MVFLLIVVRGDRRHLKILAVEAIIFVYETVGHWQKQASLALVKAFKKGMQNLMLKKFCILMLKGSQNETKMDAEINGRRNKLPESCQDHQHITKMATKIHEKSRLRF